MGQVRSTPSSVIIIGTAVELSVEGGVSVAVGIGGRVIVGRGVNVDGIPISVGSLVGIGV